MPDLAMHDNGGPPVTLIPANGRQLPGQLTVPPSPIGLAMIAKLEHGGPAAEAYAAIARVLGERRFATLLVALDADEEGAANAPGGQRADLPALAERMAAVVRWASGEPRIARLPIGLFGVDTVAAAALAVAANGPAQLSAVVGCNARTDLVDRVLGRVAIPTLLIAGTRSRDVLTANRAALAELRCEKRMVIAAGNLKESLQGRGARRVASLAARWFDRHMVKRDPPGGMR